MLKVPEYVWSAEALLTPERCKVVKKYCLIFPFTQYPGLLLTEKKKKALYSFLLQGIKFWPLATGYHNNW